MAKLRHIARVSAFQSLIAITVSGSADYERVFDYVIKEFSPELKDKDFAKKLFFGVLDSRTDIDAELQKFAPKWPIEKLCSVERCSLEIGAFELMFTDTPLAVILNEAIEIAKMYGDETAGKFVNGVLSSLAKKFR